MRALLAEQVAVGLREQDAVGPGLREQVAVGLREQVAVGLVTDLPRKQQRLFKAVPTPFGQGGRGACRRLIRKVMAF